VEDVGAHFFEHRTGAFQVGRVAAHHEGEGARDGAAGAARHGRVDKGHALGLGGLGHLARGGGSDGGAVDDQRARRQLGQQLARAEEQAFHMLAGGQHADDDFGALHGGFGVGGDGHAVCGQLVAGGLREVERAHLVACLVQVVCHGAAHVAEADECDFHVLSPVVGLR